MTVQPVLASRFEGQRTVSGEALRKLGAKKNGSGWMFLDGSTLVLISGTWRALAPPIEKRSLT